MNVTIMLIAAAVALPVAALGILAWASLARIDTELQALVCFEGMHFEM